MRIGIFVLAACCVPPAAAAPCAGFADVDTASPFCASVEWIRNRGITGGCAPGLYCPSAPATRLELAAFLQRTGDALQAANVLTVGKRGGRFASIQAAIDHAATMATPAQGAVVRVAPGTYDEAIVLVPHVEVVGESRATTVLRAQACEGLTPQAAAVTLAPNSSVRGMRIENVVNFAGHCSGVHVPATVGVHAQLAIHDVDVFVSSGTINSALRVDGGQVVVTQSRLRAEDASTGSYGLHASTAAVTARDTEIEALGTGSSTGLLADNARLDRVRLLAAGPGANRGLVGYGNTVRDSSIVGTAKLLVAPPGTIPTTIFNSTLQGAVDGPATCVQTYVEPTLAPFAC